MLMTRAVALACLLTSTAFAADKPRVAILYFDISSNDPEQQVLKKGLAEMLITDVSADPHITVVERNRLEEVVKELELQQTAKIDQSTAQRMGKLLGAQYLITGSLISQKSAGRLDAHLVRVETGEVTAAAQGVKDGDIFEAESKLAEKLNGLLAKADAHDPPKPKKAQGKLNLDTAVKYSQALDALDKKDKKTAQEKLQQVVKAQPDFMLATLELDRLMK
jgi:TolB-like protein